MVSVMATGMYKVVKKLRNNYLHFLYNFFNILHNIFIINTFKN